MFIKVNEIRIRTDRMRQIMHEANLQRARTAAQSELRKRASFLPACQTQFSSQHV